MEGLERYERELSPEAYSIMVVYPLYNSALTLVEMLHNPRTHDIFTRTCRLLTMRVADYPFAAFLLQAMKTLAQQTNAPIPALAISFFNELIFTSGELFDVPISFVLPGHQEMVASLSDDERVGNSLGLQLGTLITKWSRLSL